jgi:ATP synthase protein I
MNATSGWTAVRTGLAVTAAAGLVIAGLALLLGGGRGLAGAALGTAVVACFFSVSKAVLRAVARRAPLLLLPAALATYAVKIILLGVVLVTLQNTDVVDVRWLAWSVLVGVVGWVGAELWVATRTRVPFYDPVAFRARHGAQADHPPAASR